MGIRRFVAALGKGIVAFAAMGLTTSYGPGTLATASKDPFYPVAGRKIAAMAQVVRDTRWLPEPAPTATPLPPAARNYRPPDPLPPPGRVRTGELLAALSKD